MANKVCADCEEDVPSERLMVLEKLGAKEVTCIDCQMEREESGRHFRHRMDVQATVKCGEVDTIEQNLVRVI